MWALDLLGNWKERSSTFGAAPPEVFKHWTDERNRIETVKHEIDGVPQPDPDFRYDGAGNLIFDGEFVFQYDAWNRLVQVNQGSSEGPPWTPAPEDWTGVTIGPMVKHYTYDAVGRLVRTQSPYNEPGPFVASVRSERFYYDGIRRIQELAIDPLMSIFGAQGDPEMEALLASCMGGCTQDLDGESSPAVFEAAQTDDDDDPPTLPLMRIDREYVWGPGGVDELLVQFDPWREMMPVIQDAGGDAIALCDLKGSGGSARVVAQFTYDPYGQVIAHEHLHTHAWLRAGHKGLFVDRLDAGVANSAGDDLPRLVTGVDLVTHNRGRTGRPPLGRFLQQDPNMTGLVLLAATTHHGQASDAYVTAFDMRGLNQDGPNLYEYLGSNPSTRSDPLGLSWDPFSMVDEIAWERQLSGAFMMGMIKAYFSDKQILNKLRAYERGAFGMMDLTMDRDMGALLGLVGGLPISKICFVEGTLVETPDGPAAIETLELGREITSRQDPEFEGHEPTKLARPGEPIVLVHLLYRHADGRETSMEILRAASVVARHEVRVGDRLPLVVPELGFDDEAEVLSIAAFDEAIRLDVPVVTGRFVTSGSAIVHVWLEGMAEPIGATPKHPLFSADRQTWVPAGQVRHGERLVTLHGTAAVLRVDAVAEPETVYNVEVSRHHTYFVGEAGVWAHNPCKVTSKIRDSGLVRAAQAAGRSPQVQAGLDHLVSQLRAGNLDAGGAKMVARGITEVRHLGSGARVYFRRVAEQAVEIVAKSSKANQTKVIRILKELFGG